MTNHEPHISAQIFAEEQIGYQKNLTQRHVQMIALGGAIGSGIFLGSATLMHNTGPAILVSYIIVSAISAALMLALGELVIYRPTSSAFVSYSREFLGERWAYTVGWMYWLQWSIIGIADLSAVGSYLAPVFSYQIWPGALVGFSMVILINVTSARAFAEFEFWATILKILVIIIFLFLAVYLIIIRAKIGNSQAGLANLSAGEGFWPITRGHSTLLPLFVLNTVMFGFSAIELVAVAAGEMENPVKEVSCAIKSVLGRIIIFYTGVIFLFLCLEPSREYLPGISPFITIAHRLNNRFLSTYTPAVLSAVLIIATLSSLNSGLYASSRVLHGLAQRHEAPRWILQLNQRGVPTRGIYFTAIMLFMGILLNYYMHDKPGKNLVFDIAMDAAALANIIVWISFFACQLRYRSLVRCGKLAGGSFQSPAYPFLGIGGIFSLLCIAIMSWWSGSPTGYHFGTSHDFTTAQIAIVIFPISAIVLILGWRLMRRKIWEITAGKLDSMWNE